MSTALSFSHCPICGADARVTELSAFADAAVHCSRCGPFRVQLSLTSELLMASMTAEGRERLARLQTLVRSKRLSPTLVNQAQWARTAPARAAGATSMTEGSR